MKRINIVGGGLSGSEAAFYLANRGYDVHLYEMRPVQKSPAHHSDKMAELVCSNSLKSNRLDNACGLLKEELRILHSLVIESADQNQVPGGDALCVDRDAFSTYIHQKIINHPYITMHYEEISEFNDDITIICTGPLTSNKLSEKLRQLVGQEFLSFYDASSPIVTFESLNIDKLYYKSRHDQGDDSYLNAPLSEEEYYRFVNELTSAKRIILHEFEKKDLFDGCQPVEEVARRGLDTLRFGALKPSGLETDKHQPFAVVQLRQDDVLKSLYTLVGFQTNLTYPEQKRVFSMIPGLEKAEFTRYGLMHKNIYLCSPKILNNDLSLKVKPNLYIAGQLSGVEGYVESSMSGLVTAMIVDYKLRKNNVVLPPKESVTGALIRYVLLANPQHFSPMNAMFNLIPRYKKNEKERVISESLSAIKTWEGLINES